MNHPTETISPEVLTLMQDLADFFEARETTGQSRVYALSLTLALAMIDAKKPQVSYFALAHGAARLMERSINIVKDFDQEMGVAG